MRLKVCEHERVDKVNLQMMYSDQIVVADDEED